MLTLNLTPTAMSDPTVSRRDAVIMWQKAIWASRWANERLAHQGRQAPPEKTPINLIGLT